ncbi:MAG: GNAT family N-acetyltransferase [Bacteroidota bacterium]
MDQPIKMPHINVQIREGKREDVPQVMGLIHALAEYEKASEEVLNTAEQLAEDGFGPNPLYGLYVAEAQDRIVGMALFFYRYSTWKGKTLYLEDLYVQPQYRKQKIGKALLDVLVERARQENCQRLHWQVLDWNESAIQFYKSLGSTLDGEWINVYLDTPAKST